MSDDFKPETDDIQVLHSAYVEIRSRDLNQHLTSLTLNDLLAEHIKSIKSGEKRGNRLSRADRLANIKGQLRQVIQELQKKPEETT